MTSLTISVIPGTLVDYQMGTRLVLETRPTLEVLRNYYGTTNTFMSLSPYYEIKTFADIFTKHYDSKQ